MKGETVRLEQERTDLQNILMNRNLPTVVEVNDQISAFVYRNLSFILKKLFFVYSRVVVGHYRHLIRLHQHLINSNCWNLRRKTCLLSLRISKRIVYLLSSVLVRLILLRRTGPGFNFQTLILPRVRRTC